MSKTILGDEEKKQTLKKKGFKKQDDLFPNPFADEEEPNAYIDTIPLDPFGDKDETEIIRLANQVKPKRSSSSVQRKKNKLKRKRKSRKSESKRRSFFDDDDDDDDDDGFVNQESAFFKNTDPTGNYLTDGDDDDEDDSFF